MTRVWLRVMCSASGTGNMGYGEALWISCDMVPILILTVT
jgi:hypothetical protein